MRQALAGMLWSKQFYDYDVDDWLAAHGDRRLRIPGIAAAQRGVVTTWSTPTSSPCRTSGSTPGTPPGIWPFTPSPLALVDPDFAKQQLLLLLQERYLHPNGQVPAYGVELRRRQPAGARLGGLLPLPAGQAPLGTGRPRVPQGHLPQAADQLHLVGEPQGSAGAERVRGRVPGPGQHRRLRSAACRCRRAGTSSRPTARPGWLLRAGDAADRAGAGLEDRAYVDMALKFFEHFVWIASAMIHIGGDGEHVGRGGRLLLRRAAHARRPGPAAQGPLDGRPAAALRGRRC